MLNCACCSVLTLVHNVVAIEYLCDGWSVTPLSKPVRSALHLCLEGCITPTYCWSTLTGPTRVYLYKRHRAIRETRFLTSRSVVIFATKAFKSQTPCEILLALSSGFWMKCRPEYRCQATGVCTTIWHYCVPWLP